jgi:hypothetical protein
VPLVRKVATEAKEAGLKLVQVARGFIVDGAGDLAALLRDEVAPFLASLANDPAVRSGVLTGAGAAAVGAVVAPTFATVMGSSTLGTAAVSLGLVAAPVWPIIAGAGVGLVAGYGLWRFFAGDERASKSTLLTLPPHDSR